MKRRRSNKRNAPNPATNQATKWREEGEGMSETPENVNIGRDLLFEILARLPITCLLRFKIVSKCWYRLISSLEFINFRLKYASDDPCYTHHKLLHIDLNCEEILRVAPLYPTLCDPLDGSLETGISHPIEFWAAEFGSFALTFVGSCRGLVCIAGLYNRVVIWNPTLRKCKKLPYFGRGPKVVYGFGYDKSDDDFKVVGIRNSPKILVKIYSARANSWKKLEDDDFAYYVKQVDGHGCFLNGKLHWATLNKRIFTIDLSSESFGVMDPPDCVRMVECRTWSIHVVGEFLAAFVFNRKKSTTSRLACAYLCMMERYGVQESWTRVDNGFTDSQPLDSLDSVTKEGERPRQTHKIYVGPSEPGEVWPIISIPGHVTGNAIKAFLFYCVKHDDHYFDEPVELLEDFDPSEQPTTVYVESLVWPFSSITRA